MDYAFRILRVYGDSNPESTIHCDLIERPADAEEPAYEALSYCWSGQRLTQEIFCEGRRLLVTKNCESALRYFRPAVNGEGRLLWIDAICINQGDMAEKSGQLELMGGIYSGASRVLIWLEDESVSAERAVAPSLQLYDKGFDWLVRLGEATAAPDLHGKEVQLARVAEELGNEASELNAATINKTIVRLPWFKRLWIVQEAVLSRKAALVFSGRETSLDAMLEARELLSSMQKRGMLSVEPAASALWKLFAVHRYGKALLQSAQGRQGLQNNALYSFLSEVRYSNATNPCDKIFGLYGLLGKFGIDLPRPNYEKSTATIYRETMVALIGATKSLQLIQHVDGMGSLPGRASWVPDWSATAHSIGPSAGPCTATANSEPIFRFLEGSSILALMGHTVDKISRRSSFSYMHSGEVLGEPTEYAIWTRNPPIDNSSWAQRLEEQPQYSTAILFLWNIRVLRDFVNIALDGPPAVASRQSVLALYYTLLSQRGGHESSELGLQDPDVGERRARDFFCLLFSDSDEGEDLDKEDSDWIFGRDFALNALNEPALSDLLDSEEYAAMRRISRSGVRRLIFDAIVRIRYMTLFTTEQGRVGIAPWPVKAEDELALCSGLGLPIVMRPAGDNFNLVACAYVHGIMHHEAWTQNPDRDLCELLFV